MADKKPDPQQNEEKQNEEKPTEPPRKTGKAQVGSEVMRLKEIFPKPENLFRPPPKLTDITKDCIYVLDASFLLSPFDTGTETLEAVKKILINLTKENRVLVPAQAAREYVSRRSSKVGDIYSDLVRRRDEPMDVEPVNVRMLKAFSQHGDLAKSIESVTAAVKTYKDKLSKVIEEFKENSWSDPVTMLYHEVFKEKHIVKAAESEEELRKDFLRRCEKAIPPGFEDAGKPEGIGDVVIWHTILEVGRQTRKNVVFVTDEKKGDWWARSQAFEKNRFHPIAVRFELVNEFFDTTGKNFGLVDFPRFLEINDAKPEVVKEAVQAAKVNVLDNFTLHPSSLEDIISVALPAVVSVRDWAAALSSAIDSGAFVPTTWLELFARSNPSIKRLFRNILAHSAVLSEEAKIALEIVRLLDVMVVVLERPKDRPTMSSSAAWQLKDLAYQLIHACDRLKPMLLQRSGYKS